MTYRLEFVHSALKEWEKLDQGLRQQFKKKLAERLDTPRIEASLLNGMPDCYKIMLKSSGYRLVYKVLDEEIAVLVVAVGKRERNAVYKAAIQRTK